MIVFSDEQCNAVLKILAAVQQGNNYRLHEVEMAIDHLSNAS